MKSYFYNQNILKEINIIKYKKNILKKIISFVKYFFEFKNILFY